MDITNFYDPIEDALVAAFADVGDRFAGVIVDADEADDKYGSGRVPAFTLRLDEPFEDDEYVRIFARSKQMQRAIGRAVKRCDRGAIVEGDWLAIEYVEEAESSSGNSYKVYDVEFKPGKVDSEKSIGTGEIVDGEYQPSLFEDDAPNF